MKRSGMRELRLIIGCSATLLALSCGSKSTNTDDPSPSLALPFQDNFDAGVDSVCTNWLILDCTGNLNVSAGLTFRYDTSDFSTSHASLRAGSSTGQLFGGSDNYVYWEGSAEIRQRIDLKDKTSATLQFVNRRSIAGKGTLPPVLSGQTNDVFCYVEVSRDGGSYWFKHRRYSENQNLWRNEIVDLTEYVGSSQVKVRFTVPQHATSGNSTQWKIDNVRLTAE